MRGELGRPAVYICPHAGPVKNTCELSLQRVLRLEGGSLEVAQAYLATGGWLQHRELCAQKHQAWSMHHWYHCGDCGWLCSGQMEQSISISW
jgi:hypothetical protein